MNISDAYAHAIRRILENGKTPKDAVSAVLSSLEASGRAALLPHIARAFQRISMREDQRERVSLIVAREGDGVEARRASGSKDAPLVIDQSLIGGWRLEDKERLVDASWKKHLLSIYNRATTNYL